MDVSEIRFEPANFPASLEKLRQEVREFLAAERANGSIPRPNRVSMFVDKAFTLKMGKRGWIGMTWPKEYGGHERTALERYAVTEELLAAGAPVRAHWVTDRQTGPVLLKFGTEEQKREFLPRIARGEVFFSIGLSEPDSGSDLASLRTRAVKVEGGWKVSGTKLWNSNSHHAQYMVTLCRTTPVEGDERHKGLSQLIIDLSASGVNIRPIINLPGEHDFNEIVLEEVFVPENMLVGDLDKGWFQASTELAYERSGPERWLSAYRLLAELTEALGKKAGPATVAALGRLLAHLLSLRQMSMSIAMTLESGRAPNLEAAIVKDLGTCFEQEMVVVAKDLVQAEGLNALERGRLVQELLDHAQLWSIAFTIRGGAKEIMRGVIARGLGLR